MRPTRTGRSTKIRNRVQRSRLGGRWEGANGSVSLADPPTLCRAPTRAPKQDTDRKTLMHNHHPSLTAEAGSGPQAATPRRHCLWWLVSTLLAGACGGPEAEDITITATGGTNTGDVTITATATQGTGLDSSGDGGEPEFPGDPLTFFIEESTVFSPSNDAPGCNNDNLNNLGTLLEQAMLDAGWTGQYLNNANGSAYHFIDPGVGSPFGQDGPFSDARRVTVYAGHGNVDSLQWGSPGSSPEGAPGSCFVTPSVDMRLGSLSGDVSGAAIYATSCTGYVLGNSLPLTLGVGAEIGQHFAWHNSPALSNHLLASFFDQTGTSIIDGDNGPFPVHNREAFMGIGQSKPGFSENSPVMYTPGQSAPEVAERHYNARMLLGIGLETVIPEPQDPDVYNIAWVDNGTSDTCNP